MTFTHFTTVHAQGIRFVGGDHPIDKRTSLEVFTTDIPSFEDSFDIAFDLQLRSDNPEGYIVRIKELEQIHIYNLYYDEEGNDAIFRLNEEGKTSLITIKFDKKKLKEKIWFPVRIRFILNTGEITLKIADNSEQKAAIKVKSPYLPSITFGKSDYMIDVPAMSIRNLHIGNQKNNISFPLRESTGSIVHNASSEAVGIVKNGIWLSTTSFYWRKNKQLLSPTESGSVYNPNDMSVYYFSRDYLQIYTLPSNELRHIKFKDPCPVRLNLANSFIDTATNKLYVYETYFSGPYTGATIASLDLITYNWKVESRDKLNIELNHHGALLLPDQHKLLIFGGFGNMTYSDQFRTYDLIQQKWFQERTTGDRIFPRYFTSMGYSPYQKKAYVFGGMGNESGQHIVGRKYFYDLHEIDPGTMKIKKVWDLNWEETPFVPARGVVIPDSEWLYILGYPEHLTDSFIKLRRFSLKNGQYEQLGDSIPIYSDKISTHANLIYDEKQNKLITLVQESKDDIQSKLSIYTLDFPAISESELYAFPVQKNKEYRSFYVIVGLIILVGSVAGYRYYYRSANKPKGSLTNFNPQNSIAEEPERNRIYLFGDFTLINRQGMDISHLLSTRLKQVFFLILFHNKGAGISSKLLSYLLWPDKPKDKVKTSRGVAINNLRKVLNELDGVEVRFEEGHFMIHLQPSCYCDYQRICIDMLQHTDVLSSSFVKILKRGKFLLGIDDPLFDQIKSDLEYQLIGEYQETISRNLQQQQWSSVILAAEMILRLDPINEQALEHGLYAMHLTKADSRAKFFYNQFIEQYELIMGEEYPQTYENISKKISK